MCGIAGFNFNNEQLIRQMNDLQKHRGPDGEGIYTDDQVSLGHRRLAIIDLSEQANQPMFYRQYSIVFNGEIYNYKEIREELIQKKHLFTTNSDTEVILHAYEEWSFGCLNHFNGMWAFAIYDKIEKKLFLARDRFGIKPLYYSFDNEKFIFASEIKAIQCHSFSLSIDYQALNHYFYQKYIGSDKSIFNEIKKLDESHFMEFDLTDKTLKINKYYNLEDEISKASLIPLDKRKSRISDLISDAVEKRLISDVPVGSFLSGGIDSSIISAIIAQKHPQFDVFSIGFAEQTFNELDYAKLVAGKIGVNHHYQTLTIDENLIFEVISNLDEPFGDPSLIPTSLLSKITREKVTVCLSGDAGDELFGGYDTYLAWKLARYVPNFVVKILKKLTYFIPASDQNLTWSFKIKKFFSDWNNDIQIRHFNWMSQSIEKQRNILLGTGTKPISEIVRVAGGNSLLSIQLNDVHNYLANDILRKLDIASMAHSLEARVPFLDYRMVPLVLSLNENLKIRRFTTKFYLKQLARAYLPKQIIRRKKAGFSVPIAVWFKQSVRMQKIVTDKNYFCHQLFNYEYVQSLLNDHLRGKKDHSRILWLIFVFNLWYFHQKKS